MNERDKRARVAKLSRMRGMSSEALKSLNEHNRQRSDWTSVCRKCGARLHGTIDQITEHRCGVI